MRALTASSRRARVPLARYFANAAEQRLEAAFASALEAGGERQRARGFVARLPPSASGFARFADRNRPSGMSFTWM